MNAFIIRFRSGMVPITASAPVPAAAAAHRPLTVAYLPTASLVPDPRNARTHPRRQIDQIVASIRAFGFTNPVVADPECKLIAGHGRLLAAKEIGLTEVPVITLAGLTEAQKRALRLADNKIALNAGWDVEILKLELAELSLPEFDIDLGLTGFSSGEIDVVLGSRPDPDDEVIPAVPADPRTRIGDIWQLGEHRIGCGDGRDIAFLETIIGGNAKIDAAFLDPPTM
jgi:ParB-like chromosome segregation protein Spo0J